MRLITLHCKMTSMTLVSLVVGLLCCHLATVEASDHVTCQPGTGLPVILSAPHGGYLEPGSIPDRSFGCYENGECVWSHTCQTPDPSTCTPKTARDSKTKEQANEMYDAMCSAFGVCPWKVINELSRKKLDANREINEATFGNAEATTAYNEYVACLEYARGNITQTSGKGLLLDLHGQSHSTVRTELGYLVIKSRLNNDDLVPLYSSIKNLYSDVDVSIDFEQLVRGTDSFGDLLHSTGYDAIPSPTDLSPGTDPYYSGGHITRYYGSRYSGSIDAIQIESHIDYRSNSERPDYVAALTNVTRDYLSIHYGFTY